MGGVGGLQAAVAGLQHIRAIAHGRLAQEVVVLVVIILLAVIIFTL